MEKQLKITYHYHSGFSVQAGSTLLVFDYWEGEGRSLGLMGRIQTQHLRAFEHIVVFVSHSHPDHLDPVVFMWERVGLPITYVISTDLPPKYPGHRMEPGDVLTLEECGITVKAFSSTDLGVSYLVDIYGITVFHAGDLNLWHWRDESTLREIEAAEAAFYEALEPIHNEHIDIAMFPLDPRQGTMYDAGATHFALAFRPFIFIPMHWQDRPEVANDFARRTRTHDHEVLALTEPGMVANVVKRGAVWDVRLIDPPKELPVQTDDGLREQADMEDPFADSDLPVIGLNEK